MFQICIIISIGIIIYYLVDKFILQPKRERDESQELRSMLNEKKEEYNKLVDSYNLAIRKNPLAFLDISDQDEMTISVKYRTAFDIYNENYQPTKISLSENGVKKTQDYDAGTKEHHINLCTYDETNKIWKPNRLHISGFLSDEVMVLKRISMVDFNFNFKCWDFEDHRILGHDRTSVLSDSILSDPSLEIDECEIDNPENCRCLIRGENYKVVVNASGMFALTRAHNEDWTEFKKNNVLPTHMNLDAIVR